MQNAVFMNKRTKCEKDNFYLTEDGVLYLCIENPPTPIKYINKYSDYFVKVIETILVDDHLVKGIKGEYYSNTNGNIFCCINYGRSVKRLDYHPEMYKLIYDLYSLLPAKEENEKVEELSIDERSNDIMTKHIPEVDSIEDALDEKKRREIQSLNLELEKNELEAKIKNVKDRADILNSSRGFDDYDCNICGTHYDHNVYKRDYRGGVYVKVRDNHEIVDDEVNHGPGCHCSKCCPNPNPTFLEKNKNKILAIVIGLIMIVLAVGYSPAGAAFKAIQNKYVELLVDFFKMSLLGIAGVSIYQLFKDKTDKDRR